MRKEACRLTPSDFHQRTLVVVTMDAQLGHGERLQVFDPIREPYPKRRSSFPRRKWMMGHLVVLILLGILLTKGSLEIGTRYA
ncbi:hypothetical protein D9M70_295650 [compost metagenome]